MTDKLRVFKLRTKTEDELVKDLEKQREELLKLRVSKVAGGTAAKLTKIRVVRKTIAKYLTVINEQRRNKVRTDLAKAKRLPLDLRNRKTRAIRRALTHGQTTRKTLRQHKRDTNFPLRKFAIKA